MSPVTNSCRGGPNHGLHLICQSSISPMAKCMEKSIGCLGRELNGHLGNFGQLHTTHRYHSQPFNEKEPNLLSIVALRSITCPCHKLSSRIISKPRGYSHLPPSIQSAKGLIKSLAPLTISFLSDLDPHVKWFRLKAQAPLPMSSLNHPTLHSNDLLISESDHKVYLFCCKVYLSNCLLAGLRDPNFAISWARWRLLTTSHLIGICCHSLLRFLQTSIH